MALYDVALAVFADKQLVARERVIDALRTRDAISPATARSIAELGVAIDDTWNRLVIEGRVREGPTGQFYLFERPRGGWQRVVKTTVFFLLILLIPVVLFWMDRPAQ